MTKRKILEVKNEVEFRYAASNRVSYSIAAGLTLHEDETWCIRGVSGSGKSTLMTLLAGLRPFGRGRIDYSFQGASPLAVSAMNWNDQVGPALWRRIGFAFQRPELIRSLDVADNLALVRGNGGGVPLFDESEWQGIARSRVWRISGGETQRLGLLRALGGDQDLIFLDEPTNNLDRDNREAVADFVIRQRAGRALVVVSHDDDFIRKLEIDRVFQISAQSVTGGGIRRLEETAWVAPEDSDPAELEPDESS